MIETHGLTRRFGDRVAVDALTFSVPAGQIVGFLGPNGAGKSTTLKMLSGFLPPTAGRASILGHDVVDARREAQRALGYMPESVPLHPEMRVVEYLRFRAEIKGLWSTARDKAVSRALELADVADVSRRLIGELSKGYRQRVGLADALVASPPLLILDEPTEGLDPNQILKFRELLKGLGAAHTILLSTHILPEVEAVCSHVVIIHRGRIAAQGDLDAVRGQLQGGRRVALTLSTPDAQATAFRDNAVAAASAVLGALPGLAVAEATWSAGLALVTLALAADAADDTVEAAVARAVHAGLGVRQVSPSARTLEDVFHALTTRDAAAPAEAPPQTEAA